MFHKKEFIMVKAKMKNDNLPHDKSQTVTH